MENYLIIIETERLKLLKLSVDDSKFIFELLNDHDWIKYIGNRNIKNDEDARNYISNKLIISYEEFGYGLYLVKEKQSNASIGLCGLIKREYLENVDLGFAFLPKYRRQGYAFESAEAVIRYVKESFRLNTLLAITSLDNTNSINLLEKLGFNFVKIFKMPNDNEELKLFRKT